MKSFKKREVSGTANPGPTRTDEVHGTFDIPIEKCVMSPTNKFVPVLVEKCIKVIEKIGLKVEGIYRICGNSISITELQEELDKEPTAIDVESEQWKDVHTVTNILKLFFKKLPNSLITDEFYEPVIRLSGISHREKRLLKLKMLLEKLPKVNFRTFRLLSRHLHNVAGFRDINKMDAHNLAIMFAPALVRYSKDQALIMIRDMHHQITVVESIIKHSEWLFSRWSEDRSVPMDEMSRDSNSTLNLQFLESVQTLVSQPLRMAPVEEKPSFFSFQVPNRRSRRRHKTENGRDESGGTEQKSVPDAEREIEIRRIEIPTLPFKPIHSLNLESEQFHKTVFDLGRSDVELSASEQLGTKILDTRLISDKFDREKETSLYKVGEDAARTDLGNNLVPNVIRKGVCGNSSVIEVKKYQAYSADLRVATFTKPVPVAEQPMLLRRYQSKSTCALNNSSLKKCNVNILKKYNGPSEIGSTKSVHSSQVKPTNAVGYHPDVSQLPVDCTSENGFWENGSAKKSNIVVRGPLGRRYCVLSGTCPSVFLNGAPPTETPSETVEYIERKNCSMKCVANVKLNIIQGTASHDIQLHRIQYA